MSFIFQATLVFRINVLYDVTASRKIPFQAEMSLLIIKTGHRVRARVALVLICMSSTTLAGGILK